jgi:two-component system, LytTR family, response regulator
MDKIKALIIDDEAGNVLTLKKMIDIYCPNVEIIDFAYEINTGYDLIITKKPQLVFLDIEMPYGNGFDLLEKLMPINFEVIFITAYDNYAIKAFKYAAIDYILKPVNIEELETAVKKATQFIKGKLSQQNVELLLATINTTNTSNNKIAIPTNKGLVFEQSENILYLEASQNYSKIYLTSGSTHLVSKGLGDFEEVLSNVTFFRVHKSYIININKISRYHNGRGGFVIMEDGTEIEIAIRKKTKFLEKLGLK